MPTPDHGPGTPLSSLLDGPLPTPSEEIWRYSRIDQLDPAGFVLGSTGTHLVTTVTGADGLVVDATSVLDTPAGDRAITDVFAAVNAACATPIRVVVPAGRAVGESIVVTHEVRGEGVVVVPRLELVVGDDAEVTVIERFVSDDDCTALVLPAVHVHAGPAARVRYLAVNELGLRTWSLGTQLSIGERDSSTLLGAVALGGDYARVRTDARVIGQGASTRQVALYFADGTQMHDFRTLQDHVAPRTHSDLLFKGAVQDRSKSVYTGLIRIRHDARGAAAYQTNRNLTLSEGAWAESVPNLEIETNDVKCSHASTVGPIDDDQRFYLESRGIRPDVAERLVVLGFFDEVLAQLPVGPFADELRGRVAAKLARRDLALSGSAS